MRQKQLALLLSPSSVSVLIGLTTGVLLTAATVMLSRYQGSALQQEIFELHQRGSNNPTAYQTVTNNLAQNHVLGVAPLFILWAGVGLVVYYFAVSIVKAFGDLSALRAQMDYVHASRQSLMREALAQLITRAVSLGLWFMFIKITLSVAVPYTLAAAHVAATAQPLAAVGYGLAAVAIVAADIYIHTIFLRLITLRPRLFGSRAVK